MRIAGVVRRLAAVALLLLSQPLLAAVQLAPVVSSGLANPLFVGHAGDASNRLFIVERDGFVRVLQPGAFTPSLFLDIHTRVLAGGERGLLGLAFHPQYAANGRFFVFYTRAPDGTLVIAEYGVSADRNIANTAEKVLLTIAHPNTNHNGGMLSFGQDDYLYIGVGDGGSANDPPNNAQNIDSLLGKILRIDVDIPDAAAQTLYSSPPDNPFVGAPGRDEIFALGMRNPWRFSFDRVTGEQWVADVGQGTREEVDSPIENGGNYGWRTYEGTVCTNLNPTQCNPANYVFPRFEYAHTNGRCSITGGYVYRGSRGTLPAGTYVYGDYCTGEILAWNGSTQTLLLDTSMNISSFGEDEQGELYVVNLNGTISRIESTAPPTTTTLASSVNPAPVGASVTFTATVIGANPTGTVRFGEGASALAGCTAVPLAGTGNSRTAACTTNTLPAGTYAIVAQYSGDASNAGSGSAPLSQVIVPQQLINASFETPELGSGYQYRPSGSGVGWTFNAGAGIQGNGSAWNAAPAPDGTQTAFIQLLGSMTQTLSLDAGSYTLSFRAARRGTNKPAGSVQPVQVSMDGQPIGSLVSPSGTAFTTFNITFTLTDTGSHTLRFAGTDGTGDKSTFIDAVTITVVAAPLSNRSFEVPSLGAGYAYRPAGTGVVWTFVAGAGIQGNGSAWNAAPAPDGTQTAFIQLLGSMAQTFSLNAGSYTLSFRAARRGTNKPTGSVQPIRVSIDGQPIGAALSPSSTSFGTYRLSFAIASSGSHTIQFAGTDGTGDKSTLIDAVTLTPGAAPALVNAGFEAPALGSGYQYSPTATGWTFASGAGIQGNGSAWNAAVAPQGTQTAFIQGLGSVTQTVNLDAGSYTLSFWAARRGTNVPSGSVQPIRVSVDGQQIGTVVSVTATTFGSFTVPFTIATTGSHTIRFAGTDGSGDKSTFIDAVMISR